MRLSLRTASAGSLAAALLFALAACELKTAPPTETVGPATDRTLALADDWIPVAPLDYVALHLGKTARGDGYSVFYARNGDKFIEANGAISLRRWRIDVNQICETGLIYPGERCSEGRDILVKDRRIRIYDEDGDERAELEILEGDSLGLERRLR